MAQAGGPSTSVRAGSVLARRYEVLRELGRGGMGIVYLCRDALNGRRVALKSLFRGDAKIDAEDVWWFQQEARALAALDHPAIVRARDFDLLGDGTPYLVMDVAPGRSLLAWLELGAIPWPWPFTVLWSFVNQILAGLAHAHARGVIHGDLKPTNLMIDFPARSKLPKVAILDLGLASLVRDPVDHRLAGAERSPRVVRAGAGTPGWMAPEQIRRATPHYGPPTDLYALGSILYHLLSGREPFTGTVDEVLEGHRNKPVPDFALPNNVPPDVKPFVLRMLSKRPWQRYDFAADAMRAWHRFRPEPATEPWTFRVNPESLAEGASSTREGAAAAPALRQPEAARAPRNHETQPISDSHIIAVETLREHVSAEREASGERVIPAQATGAIARATSGAGAWFAGDSAAFAAGADHALGLLALRPSPMVARLEERAELRGLVEETCHANGSRQTVVLLYGEAGVGKSRLAEWLCEQVHEQATMIPLRARYRPIPAPLDGLLGAVNAHFGLERADRNLVERTLINCWEVTPDDEQGLLWVAATAEWLRPTPPGKTVPLGPSGKRFFFDTPELRRKVIYRTLMKIGEKRPILLWLDDLHLASPRTFEALYKLREEVPSLRVMMVATVRTEAVAVDPDAVARLDALKVAYGGKVMYLPALTPEETGQLVLSSLQLEDRAVRHAAVRSKGNALFALQLLHAWAATNRLELNDGCYRVPASVLEIEPKTTAELWDERLSAVPGELRGAALAASALGGDIPLRVLRALLGALDIPVAAAVNELQRAQILIPAGPDRLRWPHALLQEHLLAKLQEHADAHKIFRLASDALGLHPAAGTRRVVSHRVTNLLRAGDEAAATEKVLSFVENNWMRVRDAEGTLEDLGRLDGLVREGTRQAAYARWRAEALHQIGHLTEARELAEESRAEFARAGDLRNEAHALRLLGHILSEQSIGGGRDLVHEALEKFESLGDTAGRAACELVLGEIDHQIGDHKAARGRLSRAAKRFARADDPLGRGQCVFLLGAIAACSASYKDARELFAEARGDFERSGYRLGLAQCDVAEAHLSHRADELGEAWARAQAALEKMRELGNPWGEARCERLLGMIAFDEEKLDEARQHALASSALYDRIGDPWGKCESALLLGHIALASGKAIGRDLILACRAVGIAAAESRQHLALSLVWLAHVEGRESEADPFVEEARTAFGNPKITGDHTEHLLTRLAALSWPPTVGNALRQWQAELSAR